jgi:photosystem II stability/assembly factor-like uncharacterized protein
MKTRHFVLSSVLLVLALLAQPVQHSFAFTNAASEELVFDFAANAFYARWTSGAGDRLPFPGTSGDYRGYVQPIDSPVLEDGVRGMAPGLLVVPQNKYDGYVQGIYPEYTVQKNDRFQALVGCEYGATGCYVTFRLDYITSSGATKVFWQWKEKYDNRTYSVDLDLSALVGKKVYFVLTMLATGSASGDRPLWVAPRIVRPGDGQTPLPPLTPTATPFVTPPPVTPSACDRAIFVSDVTVGDGTTFSPGEAFTKTWRIKNSGSCTWSNNYTLVFYSGELMNAPTVVNLPRSVAPGETVDVTINAVAPATPGTYRSDWILGNAAGTLFGIGTNADRSLWMRINVAGAAPITDTGYDFVTNACAAQWQSGAGNLPCPGDANDTRGSSRAVTAPRMEDALVGTSGLVTIPQNKVDGYIQGVYPTFTVQPGDRFQAVVGCEYGWSCYVTFRLDYLTPDGASHIYWQWMEKNEGRSHLVDLDLTPLVGQSLRFALTTLATGPATNDHALWASPRIVRPGLQIGTPTPTPITNPGTVVANPLIRKLFMLDVSEGIGWAAGDNYILRTLDGGVTWYNVLSDVSPAGAYFQNTLNGWVLANSNTLYRTTNGGSSWRRYDVPFNGGFIQFLDDKNGFVLSGELAGMYKHPVSLYQTTDGGATWTRKYTNIPTDPNAGSSLPFGGHKDGMTFRDTLNGWVGGEYPSNSYFYLYRTSDGGVTWSRLQLTLPAGYESAYVTTTAPKFLSFGTQEAILPVWMTLGAGMRDLFLYVSHDGGTTWTPSRSSARNAGILDIISSDAISWNQGNYFYFTHNKGYSWPTVTPNINIGENLRGLDFVSAVTGWLILAPVNGSTPLYRTTNGGYTWMLVSGPPAPATVTPTPDPATYPQSIVDALNARNFDAVKASMDQTVAFAYWQSQGTASTPDQAIEALRTTYLGTTPLTSHPNEDLNALLGGYYSNPYAIMGLDPAKSQALFVTGWGADGKTEAILYVTRRADGSLYLFGLLIAPNGFIHAAPTMTPTTTPTATTPPATADWPVYANTRYGFTFKYPGYLASQNDTAAHIDYLPIVVAGTNLGSKFMDVRVNDGVDACSTAGLFLPLPGVPVENVGINGFTFTKEQGSTGAMGTSDRYVAYSTLKGRTCVTLLFGLRYERPEFYPTPPWPLFDFALESAIFDQIMSTFAWPDLPSGTVMAVNLAADVGLNSCSPGPVHVELTGDIATNGPATVIYHWEIMGDSVQGVTPDQSLTFSGAAIQTVTVAFDLPCGSHAILLRVTSPNVMSGQVNVPLYPSAPTITDTPTPTLEMTPTLTMTPTAALPSPTPEVTAP